MNRKVKAIFDISNLEERWDSKKANNLKIGDSVIWIHQKSHELIKNIKKDELYKILTIKDIKNKKLNTEFGDYFIESGKNVFEPCGCKKLCDCYGKIYLQKL